MAVTHDGGSPAARALDAKEWRGWCIGRRRSSDPALVRLRPTGSLPDQCQRRRNLTCWTSVPPSGVEATSCVLWRRDELGGKDVIRLRRPRAHARMTWYPDMTNTCMGGHGLGVRAI